MDREEKARAMNRREAAEYCGISVMTIDRALAKGQIGHYRVGKRVLFDSDRHLDEFLRRNEVKPK